MNLHNNTIEPVEKTMAPGVVFLVLTMYQQTCLLPAYKLAVEEANSQYGKSLNYEVVSMIPPDSTTCVQFATNLADLTASFYYRTVHFRKTVIFISSSKSAARLYVQYAITITA